MYKFTNGIVVFDEKTRDNYLKTGYKLVEKVIKEQSTENEEQPVENNKELNENSSNDGTIEEKPRRSKKISK